MSIKIEQILIGTKKELIEHFRTYVMPWSFDLSINECCSREISEETSIENQFRKAFENDQKTFKVYYGVFESYNNMGINDSRMKTIKKRVEIRSIEDIVNEKESK